MVKSKYRFTDNPSYSLHDSKVTRIEIEGKNIKLFFEDGFEKITNKNVEKVYGHIELKDVDFDFSFAYVLSSFGYCKKFRGEKLPLFDFISNFKNCSFEITDELFGYNKVTYCGYLYTEGKTILKELQFDIYLFGDIEYIEYIGG